jgi:hypothetical protein
LTSSGRGTVSVTADSTALVQSRSTSQYEDLSLSTRLEEIQGWIERGQAGTCHGFNLWHQLRLGNQLVGYHEYQANTKQEPRKHQPTSSHNLLADPPAYRKGREGSSPAKGLGIGMLDDHVGVLVYEVVAHRRGAATGRLERLAAVHADRHFGDRVVISLAKVVPNLASRLAGDGDSVWRSDQGAGRRSDTTRQTESRERRQQTPWGSTAGAG